MTINLGKKFLITLVTLLVVAVIYNVVYFAVPWDRANNIGAFWISYGFTWLSLISAGIITAIAFNKKELKSRVFGIPILYVGFVLVIIQLLFDVLIMSIAFGVVIPFWVSLVFEVILFGFVVISTVTRAIYRDTIDEIDSKQVKNKEFIKELRIKANALLNSNTLNDIQHDLEKLVETIRFSDPISSKDVVDIEDSILSEFEKLEAAVNDKKAVEALEEIRKIDSLLKERKDRNHK